MEPEVILEAKSIEARVRQVLFGTSRTLFDNYPTIVGIDR